MKVSGREIVKYISATHGKNQQNFWKFFNGLDSLRKAELLQSYIVDYLSENIQTFEYKHEDLNIIDRIVEVSARNEFKILLVYILETEKNHDVAFIVDTLFRYISSNYQALAKGKRRDAKPFLLKLVSELFDIDIELTNVSTRYIKTDVKAKYAHELTDVEYSVKQQVQKQKNKQNQSKQKHQYQLFMEVAKNDTTRVLN